jgi:hypothetical protein
MAGSVTPSLLKHWSLTVDNLIWRLHSLAVAPGGLFSDKPVFRFIREASPEKNTDAYQVFTPCPDPGFPNPNPRPNPMLISYGSLNNTSAFD